MPSFLDLTDITLFADDNYALVWNKCNIVVKADMKAKLELTTNWLNYLDLKINEKKTELCLFHRKEQPPLTTIKTSKAKITLMLLAWLSTANLIGKNKFK